MDNLTVNDGALNVGLPKWPAMVVTGQPVTVEQAAEILFRTDYNLPDFSYAGNDRGLRLQLNAMFGIPEEPYRPYNQDETDEEREARIHEQHAYWNALEDLRRRCKKLDIDYLCNARIVSAFIGGPHGWCDWTGRIWSNDYNIGKWPEADDVAQEWVMIAEAFPFLDLQCVLYDAESCEEYASPVVKYTVKGGQVVVDRVGREFVIPPESKVEAHIVGLLTGGLEREQGIKLGPMRELLETVYGEIPKYNPQND